MRSLLVLFSVLITAVVFLVFSVGTAVAQNPQHGCPAFGQFMGAAASSSAQNEHPLGQVIKELTPFGVELARYKEAFCG
jgi:hypothetical protein